jgi:hypothetical protein
VAYAADQAAPWPVPPNWAQSVLETLQWLTDWQRARDGEVTKRELREAPRRQLQFTVCRRWRVAPRRRCTAVRPGRQALGAADLA